MKLINKKKYLISLLIFVIALINWAYFVMLPYSINISKHKPEIVKYLKTRIDVPYSLGNLKLKTTWDLGVILYADSIKLSRNDGENLIYAKNVEVKVPILPLLTKKVYLKEIAADYIDINATRSKKGVLDLTKIVSLKSKPRFKIKLEATSLRLGDYKMIFTDNFYPVKKNFAFSGKDFAIKSFTPNSFIDVSANDIKLNSSINKLNQIQTLANVAFSTSLPLNTKSFEKNKLKFSGKVNNLELNELKPYLQTLLHRKYKSLAGNIDLAFDFDFNNNFQEKRSFYIKSSIENLDIAEKKKNDILFSAGKTSLELTGNFDNKDLFLDNFSVEGNNINANIQGKIADFAYKKTRNLDIKANFINTNLKTVAELFPKNVKVKLDPFNKILKHNVEGIASGNIILKGYYKTPNMLGKIKYSGLSVIKQLKNTPKGYGTVNFLGSTIVIDVTHYISPNEFVKTTGSIVPFKGKNVNLKVSSTPNIDLKVLEPILLAIRDIFEFKLTPVTEMQIEGTGRANLNIYGATQKVFIDGSVEVKNASSTYITLAGKAEKVNGKINFIKNKVYYDDLTGYVQGMRIIPSGYTTLLGYSDMKLVIPQLDLVKAQKFVYASPLLKEAQVALKDVKEVKGVANTEIHLIGTQKDLISKGKLKFNNAYLSYNGYGKPFDKIKGQLRYDKEYLYFDNINGFVLGNNVTVNGKIGALNKKINLSVFSPKINLRDAKDFVMTSSLLAQTHTIVEEYTSINGDSAMQLNLKGIADKDCLQSLIFNNPKASFEQSEIGFPVKITKGTLKITDDEVTTEGLNAHAAGMELFIKGRLYNLKANLKSNAPVIPDLEVKTSKFNPSAINEIMKSSLVPKKIIKIVENFSSPEEKKSGNTSVYLRIKPKSLTADINFDDFYIYNKPQKAMVFLSSGKLKITDNSLYFNNLRGKISNSILYLNGNVKNFYKNPSFDVISSLEFNKQDADRLANLIKQPVEIKENIPFSTKIKGTNNNWTIQAKVSLDKGTSLTYAKQLGLPEDKIKLLTLDAVGHNDSLKINSLRLDMYDNYEDLSNISKWAFNVESEKENLLNFSGSIDELKSLKPKFKNFRIYTNTDKALSVCVLNCGVSPVIKNGNENFLSEGNINADLTVNGSVYNPDIKGYISFSGIKIPDYNLKINKADFLFAKDAVYADFKDFKVADSVMKINATIDYPLQTPLMLKNVNIVSDYINMDNIAKVLVTNKSVMSKDSKDIKIPDFVIKNGFLDAKELIMRDLITTDAKANISYTADGLFSVSDIKMKAAGGTGTGNLDYNVKSSELALNLVAKNMQANALTTTIFRFPNEVYGTLNGEGQFYTSGKTTEEMISNTNGYASFKIYDGRLVRLGSMEYFLRAANVLQSGIGGLNFNNIIDLVIPQKTGWFEKLEGRVDIKEGVISTDEITTSGENLSLYISGNFDMLTNYTDAKILGKLSRKVSGLLGPLGSFSVNQFIGYVSGVGFMPSTQGEKGLIDFLPALSKIPVLGLDSDKKNRQFVVDINGNLYEQSSVKSFRWLD